MPAVRDVVADGSHDARRLPRFEDDDDGVGLGSLKIRVNKIVATTFRRVYDWDVAFCSAFFHPGLKGRHAGRRADLKKPGANRASCCVAEKKRSGCVIKSLDQRLAVGFFIGFLVSLLISFLVSLFGSFFGSLFSNLRGR